MRAHDVRRLRACDVCSELADKDEIIVGQGATLCGRCAIRRAGGLEQFMAKYPFSEWAKLTMDTVGVVGMKKLLARFAPAHAAIRKATAP